MSEFLLEIYSEEIPAKIQEKSCRLLQNIFLRELKLLGIETLDFKVEIAPCRIAFFSRQIKINNFCETEIRGPSINAPDIALAGFLKKNNIVDKNLLTESEGYYYFKKVAGDQKINDILTNNLSKIIDLCQSIWPRRMRWNESKKEWIRPIRNILCILDGDIIGFNYAGLQTNNISFGNKNITNKIELKIFGIDDYLQKLEQNFVILKRNDRLFLIESKLAELEQKHCITTKMDRNKALLSEVAGLCEYPIMVAGEIPDIFLNIPECIIEQKIKNDQKYFVSYANGNLAKIVAMFIEGSADKINYILQGNMRVLNARLSDAQFFYNKDIELFSKYKTINEEVIKELLSPIPVGEQLGNLYDKVQRISQIMQNLCKISGNDILGGLDLQTIILHLKLDMATNAYKEFPDLQGFIGSEYTTRIWNLSPEYSDVFAAQHGVNVGYGEHVPAIANALEYVASHLYIGSEFTSSSDPFAIERSINFISSIYEWIPGLGLHGDAIKKLLPPIFSKISDRLSEILIKSAKKVNIKRIKIKFDDYLYVSEVCDYYFNQKIEYFSCQNEAAKALDWLNIAEDSASILPIYKRCKNISESERKDNIKITLIEWGQINDMLDILDIAIANNDENQQISKITWNALIIDLDRYFNNYKISDSIDRMIFIKNISNKIEKKYPFLAYIYKLL